MSIKAVDNSQLIVILPQGKTSRWDYSKQKTQTTVRTNSNAVIDLNYTIRRLHSHSDLSTLSGLCYVLQHPEQPNMHDMTYLHPVGLAEAGADTGSKGTSRHTADHYRHALLTGAVALQLYLTAQFTIGQVSLVASAVDRETPVVLLTTLGQ